MLSTGTLCSLLLLSVFWVDFAMAGSSFLSPKNQKLQQRKESKKPPAKLQPRATEGWLHPEDGSQAEGTEDGLKIRNLETFSDPFSSRRVRPQPTRPTFEWSKNPYAENRKFPGPKILLLFNAPFDIGIKLSGAQYQQHGWALGKFLQDILWEEAKEAPADK